MAYSIVSFFRTTIARQLAGIFDGIADIVASHAYRQPADAPAAEFVCARLRRLVKAMERLALRFAAGLPMQRPATQRPANATPAVRKPRAPATPAPVALTKGWLLRFQQRSAQYIPRVEAMLQDPENRALLAACPQARRLLRPLLWMLHIDPPAELALPPRPRPAVRKPRKPRPPRHAKPRPRPAKVTYPWSRPGRWRKHPAPD